MSVRLASVTFSATAFIVWCVNGPVPAPTDRTGMLSGQTKRRGTSDVLAGEVHRAEIQLLDQLAQTFGGERARVVTGSVGGVAKAGQVDGDHAVLGGQGRDDAPKRPPALRKAMDE